MLVRLYAVLVGLALLAGCASRATTSRVAARTLAANHELTVVTWNIRIGVGPEDRPTTKDPSDNLRAIAAAIVDRKADVVLLQEVDRGSKRTGGVDELAMLGEATGMQIAWAPTIENDAMVYGIGVLSRWPIRETQAVKLPRIDYTTSRPDLPEWYSEPRAALVARVDAPCGPISIVNTHQGLTKEQRKLQLAEVAGLAKAEHAAGRIVIVGGDLNCEPDAPELSALRALLHDVYQGHSDRRELEYDMAVRDRLTFPTVAPDRCIDYLFVTPEAFTVRRVEVPGVPLSDHLPVLVELATRGK